MWKNLGQSAKEQSNNCARQLQQEREQGAIAQTVRLREAETARAAEIKGNLQTLVQQAITAHTRSLNIFETSCDLQCWSTEKKYWTGFLDRRSYMDWKFIPPTFIRDLFNYCQDQGLSPEWNFTEPYSGRGGELPPRPAKLAIIISW